MNQQLKEYMLPANFIATRAHAEAPWPAFNEAKFNERVAEAFRGKWIDIISSEELEDGSYEFKYYWESQEWYSRELYAFKEEWQRFVKYVAAKFKVHITCIIELEDRDCTASETFVVKG